MKINPINRYVVLKYVKKLSNCYIGQIIATSESIPVRSVRSGIKVGNQVIYTTGTCFTFSDDSQVFVVSLENILGVYSE